jgi:type I restriction enzyme S subunit
MLEAHEPSARYLVNLQPAVLRQFGLLATATKGVARLRELIVTLAVQGQLLPQSPDDESAEQHLARVRLAKRKRMTRQVMPEPVDESEQQFELPRGWTWCRLSDLALPQAGFAFKSSGFNEVGQGRPLIRIRDVGSDSGPTTYFAGEFREEFVVEAGEWLISMDGEFRVRTWRGPAALLNQRVTRLIFFSAATNQAFVAAALQRKLHAVQGVKAYTTVDHLSGKQIAESVVALPPEPEQARIVARIDELMHLCDALEAKGRLEAEQHARLLSTLLGTLTDSRSPEELAANWQRVAAHFDLLLDRPEAVDALERTLVDLAVHGLLAPQDALDAPESLGEPVDADVPYELPANWQWLRFSQVAEIASNLVSPTAHQAAWQVAPDCIEKGTGRLLERRTVAQAGVKSANHRFVAGQLLYSKIRPSLSKVTRVDFSGLCSADMYPVNARVEADYLLLYMLSRPFLDQVSIAENRVKMPKLNQEALNAFLVAVPPRGEQRRIVARVAQLRRLCADLRQRLATSRATQARLADAIIESATA